jgi:3-oxoacyl-[acyl-carrier-protein] synthase-1
VSELVVIAGAGALCAVGQGIAQVYASVRAGLGGFRASPVLDRRLEPIRLALVPEPALEPFTGEPALPPRFRRLLRLAGPALREACGALPEGTPAPALFLGLPEPHHTPTPNAERLAAWLSGQAGVELDPKQLEMFPRGRSAALLALDAAFRAVGDGRLERALVGGLDSYLDLVLLAELELEDRLLRPRTMDGFVPGEGAAFLLLESSRARSGSAGPRARVLGVATALDPGHRYASEPARGEGLAQALETLFARSSPAPGPIQHTFAGLNGEHFGAKEWGVARLRHRARFSDAMRMEHPADCFGDTGAASGALLLALAHTALTRGDRRGTILVWSSSDREDRACALLDLLC